MGAQGAGRQGARRLLTPRPAGRISNMSAILEIPFRASIRSPRPAEETLAYLSNWPESVGKQFRGLKSFRETSPGVYSWEFEEVGYQSFKLTIAFSTKSETTATVASLNPMPGPHRLRLKWTVAPEAKGCRADLDLNFTVELPVPGIMKGLVSGFAKTELTKLLERYAANVEQALKK